MSDFEWKTEEDDDWIEDAPEQAPRHGVRRWLPTVVAVLLVAVVGLFGWRQLRSTVDEVSAETETELRATYQLLVNSAATGDIDITNSLLSGADREWTVGFQMMVGENGMQDRTDFGLELVPGEPQIQDVSLSPSFRSAEITVTAPYEYHVGNGTTQTVNLLQHSIFRRGETRWLFAPPEIGYWGNETVENGNWFYYIQSDRDAELIGRLMRDIELEWGRLCSQEAILNCKAFVMTIDFATEPLSLVEISDNPLLDNTQTLTLPTPTLVGLPADENAYRALRSGYARLIFRTQLAQTLHYECCEQQTMFDVLVDGILVEMGLQAGGVSAETIGTTLANLDKGNFPRGWNDSPETTAPAIAENTLLIDYLQSVYPHTSRTEALAYVTAFDDPAQWMLHIGLQDDEVRPDASANGWSGAIFEGLQWYLADLTAPSMTWNAVDRPVDLPVEKFAWACGDYERSFLIEDTGVDRAGIPFDSLIYEIATLPNNDGYWIGLGAPTGSVDSRRPTQLYRADGLYNIGDSYMRWENRADPSGNLLHFQQGDRFYNVDMRKCADGLCRHEQVPGDAKWTEDGEFIHYTDIRTARMRPRPERRHAGCGTGWVFLVLARQPHHRLA